MRTLTILALAPALLLAAAAQAADLGEKQADMWSTAEWAVTNDSYEGNPFDGVATATFDHGKLGTVTYFSPALTRQQPIPCEK